MTVEVKITGDSAGAVAAMQQASTAVSAGVEKMNTSLTALVSGALASVAGLTTALVKSMIDSQDAMSKAAQKAGVTTEQFSGMSFAAKLADVGVDELTRTYARLSRTLVDAQQGQKEAVELLQRMKIDPKGIKDGETATFRLARSMKQPTGSRTARRW